MKIATILSAMFLVAATGYAHNKVVVIPMGSSTPAGPTYSVGGTGPAGGIVFFTADGGIHGLEAAPTDQDSGMGAAWGCFGTTIDGANGTAIGTGAQNTTEILAGCSENNIAASLADAYSLNGFSDWHLPSREALNLMHTNLVENLGMGGFANEFYWSSSEIDGNNAWDQDFEYGGQGPTTKNVSNRVRAVRDF